MPANTTRGGFRYPVGADNSRNVRTDLQNLAEDIDDKAALIIESAAGSRPAAGVYGRFHRATDTGAVSLDTGTAWVSIPTELVGQAYDSARLGGVAAPLYLLASDASAAYLPKTAKGAQVYRVPVQSIANNTVTAVQFDTEAWDTDGMATLGTNNDRLTIMRNGIYQIVYRHKWVVSSLGTTRLTALDINSAGTFIAADRRVPLGASDCVVTLTNRLSAGDYVRALVYQDSGGALDLASGFPSLTALYLGD